jgi:hypothetical protein
LYGQTASSKHANPTGDERREDEPSDARLWYRQRDCLRSAVARGHGVALQVAFERQTLKPVFSLDRL